MAEKLAQEKKDLAHAYQECYANNPDLLNEVQKWERVQNADWAKGEKKRSVKK